MSKTVQILTLIGTAFHNNYGQCLQAYALQYILEKFGCTVEIINFVPSDIIGLPKNRLKKAFRLIKELKIGQLIDGIFNLAFGTSDISKKKENSFESFVRSHLKLSKNIFYNIDQLSCNLKPAEYIIVGSDQVWYPWTIDLLKIYLLGFRSKPKKISYAASIGTNLSDKYKELFRDYLTTFDFISVREKTSMDELSLLTNKKIEIALDPTLLLNCNEWKKIEAEPEFPIKDNYTLVYDLVRSDEILESADKIARKLGMPLVCYSHLTFRKKIKYRSLMRSICEYGPREFLWFISNSNYVITSSFHGVAFSILYKKPFIAINPFGGKYGLPVDKSMRIKDLLRMLELDNRFLDDPRELKCRAFYESINWQNVEDKLLIEREKSINYLKRSLSLI